METEPTEAADAERVGLAARLGPPPAMLAEMDDGAGDDPFAPANVWPEVPLPPRPSRTSGRAICEAPRVNDGMVYLTRTAQALGWARGTDLAVHFDVEERTVVLRPAAYPLSRQGGATVGMWAGLRSELDARYRVRIPPPGLMALGVGEGGLLLSFGRQLPAAHRDADAQRTAVLLTAAQDHQPGLWIEHLEW